VKRADPVSFELGPEQGGHFGKITVSPNHTESLDKRLDFQIIGELRNLRFARAEYRVRVGKNFADYLGGRTLDLRERDAVAHPDIPEDERDKSEQCS